MGQIVTDERIEMGLTRRQAMMMASLGALTLAGCKSTSSTSSSGRPVANWDRAIANPSANQRHTAVRPPYQQPVPPPSNPTIAAPVAGGIQAISRTQWTRIGPARSKVNAMNGISKLTIHHDGMDPSYFSSKTTVAERIEKIRNYHTSNNGWGDIGYHYIVDRAGRVWEGRPIQYQGAHVRNNNENNVGILVMGNFDKQKPTDAQLKALYAAAAALTKQNKIKTSKIRSHQEINKTACPGKNLQNKMNALRKHVA